MFCICFTRFPADSGISDTEDEDKPAGKEPVLIKAPGTEAQDQSEARETTNGAADLNQEETKLLPTTEKVTPVLVESQVPVVVTNDQTPTVQEVSERSEGSVSREPEEPVKVETSTTPSEEDNAKSIDVVSVASEEKPVDMEEGELPSKLVTKEEETTTDERIEVEAPKESEMTIAEVRQPTLSETLETPVSDKKRPLEKAVDEDDDSEHSPDAKQPRIFSPDKVNIFIVVYIVGQRVNVFFLRAGDRRQSRCGTDGRHSS
jgi:hypothetical protein